MQMGTLAHSCISTVSDKVSGFYLFSVYVAKFADDMVSVIDGTERAVTATVSMGHSSLGHGVAVDPDSHAVYVTSFNDDTVSVIELAQ